MNNVDKCKYRALDLITTSEAERKRNKYWDLKQLLYTYIFTQRLDLKIAALQDNFNSIHNTFQNNGINNSGRFATEFDNKEDQTNSDASIFIGKLWEANNALIAQYNAVVDKYNYWKEIAIQEDKDFKEYSS